MTELVAFDPLVAMVELRADSSAPNPAAFYLSRMGPGSRSSMHLSLQVLASFFAGRTLDPLTFPWHSIRYEHAQAARAALEPRYAPATVNRHLAALRGVLKECWRLGLITEEERARASDVASIRSERLPAGREVGRGELRELFAACGSNSGARSARDSALLAVLFGCGLRRSEAVGLDIEDWRPDTQELVIRNGKGSKARIVYGKGGTAAALAAWLVARGNAPGPLICPVLKGGRIQIRRMSGRNVLHLVEKLARSAAVARFTPHDLRRTFISNLLDASADLKAVQDLAGHANIGTTAKYDRRGERAKSKTAELLFVPYVPSA